MLWNDGMKLCLRQISIRQRRHIHYDGRHRLSNFWAPTQTAERDNSRREEGHDLLLRAGFLRQAHSGIFHLLPLGLRVQNKIEQLIDKHMLRLGAAKVSLSSLSSEDLWRRSGRLEGRDSELFRFQDRKEAKYLLSPTHEEEITTIVANAVQSYKDLPLRLYQVSRKYRDEARPRQGLLRGREFLMKDLYTFDVTEQQATQTYEDIRQAYSAILDELKLPYLMAKADSGKMGGNLSHEYHFVSSHGEDTILSCRQCGFTVNEEIHVGGQAQDGAICPQCHQAAVKPQRAIEIAHTFHLGTRYSVPLQLKVLNAENRHVFVEMGCHGIGVSRLIGAVASLLADEKGLGWPLAIAPFGIVVVPGPSILAEDANQLYDLLAARGSDVVLDDRARGLAWKLNDADLIGHPFIAVIGRNWVQHKAVELQCRRLGVKKETPVEKLVEDIAGLSKLL